jgi:vancomycin resistance protein YoaR
MSTRLTEIPTPFADARNIPWRAFLVAFVLTVLAVLLFIVSFAIALTGMNAGHIVPGTVVAGVPLGGLDRPSAEVRLRQELPSLSAGHLSVSFGSVQAQIGYSEIGRDYDLAAMLDQAFEVARDGDVLDQAQQQLRVSLRGATIEPRVMWDESKLEARLLALSTAASTPPVDATISRESGHFVAQPSSLGTSVDVQAAWQQALAAVNTLSPADAQVKVDPVIIAPAVFTEQAQVAVDRAERVASSDLTLTSDGLTQAIPADTIRGWVRLDGAGPGTWNLVVERDPVAQFVAMQSATVYEAPTDASFKWQGGQAVPVPGSKGLELDVATTTDAVFTALTSRADGAPTSAVAMTIRAVDPNFTTAQAIDLAPKVKKISSWTTGFLASERNFFGANITVPAGIINGTVVPAGAKFDFWATVGSLANVPGIGPGGFIDHGRTNPTGALGGGICSCSTTLWNAALRAGLDMRLRANHAYYINRYPTGLDATVFRSGSSVQNMTFFNDTDYPIIIRGLKGTSKSDCSALADEFGSITHSTCVIFEIWGVPFHRTVSFSKPVITDLKVAEDFIEYATLKPDKTPLLPGERLRLEYPTNGFRSVVVRTVRDADGNIVHRDTFSSKYVRVPGMTLIGWQEGDPPIGESLPNPDPLTPIQPPEAPKTPA